MYDLVPSAGLAPTPIVENEGTKTGLISMGNERHGTGVHRGTG